MIVDELIPEVDRAAVDRGLQHAFGATETDDIRPMTKGHTSALVFRIVVRGTPYLLRIIKYRGMLGPERHFSCMGAAANAGLAPRVWYTSLEDQLSITDFIDEVPFPMERALTMMPATLRSLHTLPPFPGVVNHFNTTCMFLLHSGPARDGLFQKFREARAISDDECTQLFAWHAQLTAAYPRVDEDMVSSHNDLFKPDNTLFDGHRVWLVDWEAAFLNDRYADLAAVANLVTANHEEERVFLQEYFGQAPDGYQLARFFLVQQLAHMFYTMAFLMTPIKGFKTTGSLDARSIDHDNAPDFETLRHRMWAGEINLADQEARYLYGRANWKRLVRNMQGSCFEDALKIVSAYQPQP